MPILDALQKLQVDLAGWIYMYPELCQRTYTTELSIQSSPRHSIMWKYPTTNLIMYRFYIHTYFITISIYTYPHIIFHIQYHIPSNMSVEIIWFIHTSIYIHIISYIIHNIISYSYSILVGGWPTPLKNHGVHQLGWWNSQY